MRENDRKIYLLIHGASFLGVSFLYALSKKYRRNAKNSPMIFLQYENQDDVNRLNRIKEECSNLDIYFILADLSMEDNVIALINQMENYGKEPNVILFFQKSQFASLGKMLERNDKYRELDTDQLRKITNENLYAFLVLTRYYLPRMHQLYGNRVLVLLEPSDEEKIVVSESYSDRIVRSALLEAVNIAADSYGNKNLKINAISLDKNFKEKTKKENQDNEFFAEESLDILLENIFEMLSNRYLKNGWYQKIELDG